MRLPLPPLLALVLSCTGQRFHDKGSEPTNGLRISVRLDEQGSLAAMDELALEVGGVVFDGAGPSGPVSVQNASGGPVGLIGGIGESEQLALELHVGSYQDVALVLTLADREGRPALAASGRFLDDRRRGPDSGDTGDDDDDDDSGTWGDDDDDDDDDDTGEPPAPEDRWALRVDADLILDGHIEQLELGEGLDLSVEFLLRPDQWLLDIDPDDLDDDHGLVRFDAEHNVAQYEAILERIRASTRVRFPGELD